MTTTAFDKARLGRMHDVMAAHVDRGIPGLVTVVSRHGDVEVDAVGAVAVGGAPVRRDSIFRISSMTKPVTAAAAMLLVEECRLRLDDPVDAWLPELADRRVLRAIDSPVDDTVPAARPSTLRDLLTFTFGSGLIMAMPGTYPIQAAEEEAGLMMGPPNPAGPPAPDEWIRRFATLPLVHQPGQRWMYNTSADVLGVLVARAAGQPLDAFLRQRIFEPLGMRDTGFSVPADQLHRLVTAYWSDPATGELRQYDPPEGQWSTPPAFPSGAGGLVSTADDFLAFAKMLLAEGVHDGDRLLSRASVAAMATDQLTPAQKDGASLVDGFFDTHGWGFGMAVVTKRADVGPQVGSYGWDGGLGTTWTNDQREDLVAILLTQQAWTSPQPPAVAADFQTGAYQALGD